MKERCFAGRTIASIAAALSFAAVLLFAAAGGVRAETGGLLQLAGSLNLPGTCTRSATGYSVRYGALICYEFRHVCRDGGVTLVVYSLECFNAPPDGGTFNQS